MSEARSRRANRRHALATSALLLAVGCNGAKSPPTPPPKLAVPTAVRHPETTLRVFQGEEETPSTTYPFEGGVGSVRVTMEIAGAPGSSPTANPPPSINDVLFKAEGVGRIVVSIKKPWPEHPNGRVTIACVSGDQESSATFEPELWHHLHGAIVTLESSNGEGANPVLPGKEIILARYVARNLPRDLHVTFKALFTREPVTPRTKAGLKPPR